MKLKTCIFNTTLVVFIFTISSVWGYMDFTEKDNNLVLGRYKVKINTAPKQFISGVSMANLSKEILPDYELRNTMTMDWLGKRYTYKNSSTNIKAEITLAVYPSVRKADESALSYMNSIAGILTLGTKSGVKIGDCSWYSGSGIIFIRNNVYVEVLVYEMDESYIEKVALSIDSALVSGTSGVKLSTTPPKSLIQSIEIPTKLHSGEEKTIQVNPNTIDGKSPKYGLTILTNFGRRLGDFSHGINDTGKSNYTAKSIGKEKILIYTYDDECRVSWEIKEIEVVP